MMVDQVHPTMSQDLVLDIKEPTENRNLWILLAFSVIFGIICDAFYYSVVPFLLTLAFLLVISFWYGRGVIEWEKTRAFFSARFQFPTPPNNMMINRLSQLGYPIVTILLVTLHVSLYLAVALQDSQQRQSMFNTLTGYCNNTQGFCPNNATSEYLYRNQKVETIFGSAVMNGLPEYGALPFHLHLIINMIVFSIGAVRFELTFGPVPVLFIWIFTIISSPYGFGSYIGYGSSVIAVSINAAYLGAVYKQLYSMRESGHRDKYQWLKIVSLNWSAFLFTILSAILAWVANTPLVGNLNHSSGYMRSIFVGALTQCNWKKDKPWLLVSLIFCWCLVYGLNTLQKYTYYKSDSTVAG